MSNPILSIICPTFERTYGLKRLIESIDIGMLKSGLVEIIVTDDSLSDTVVKYCSDKPYLTYKKHKNSSNPVDNWNSGLRLAQGTYVQVLHHDEYPARSTTYSEIINILLEQYYDVIVPRCHFIKDSKKIVSRFMQSFFTQRITLFFPYLILGFNVIGSPSLFIYKNHGEIFDKNLAYLVDVDFYFKKLKHSCKNIKVALSNSVFLSDTTFDDSITKSLSKNLELITLKEQKYILNKAKNYLLEKLMIRFVFYCRSIVNRCRH
jgi:glycosyltransferase involved in cell wall biosynthesis